MDFIFLFPAGLPLHRAAILAALVLANVTVAAPEPSEAPTPSPKVVRISEGVFKIGEVMVDENRKTVSFPANVSLDRGFLEYALVGIGGKTHESLFSTKVEPYHLHLAMLLLGAKVPKQDTEKPPPEAIDAQYLKTAAKPRGDAIIIRARWNDGRNIETRIEDLIFNEVEKAPMNRGPWVYNGSILNQGIFLAQQERSMIALVIDPSALINNTRPGCENDQIWTVRTVQMPKAGTPVEILIQLQSDNSETKPAP